MCDSKVMCDPKVKCYIKVKCDTKVTCDTNVMCDTKVKCGTKVWQKSTTQKSDTWVWHKNESNDIPHISLTRFKKCKRKKRTDLLNNNS